MAIAVVAAAAGLAPTLAIITSYLLGKRDARAAALKVATEVATVRETVAHTAAESEAKLEEIHVLVNSRLTNALELIAAGDLRIEAQDARIADLETRLQAANDPGGSE